RPLHEPDRAGEHECSPREARERRALVEEDRVALGAVALERREVRANLERADLAARQLQRPGDAARSADRVMRRRQIRQPLANAVADDRGADDEPPSAVGGDAAAAELEPERWGAAAGHEREDAV